MRYSNAYRSTTNHETLSPSSNVDVAGTERHRPRIGGQTENTHQTTDTTATEAATQTTQRRQRPQRDTDPVDGTASIFVTTYSSWFPNLGRQDTSSTSQTNKQVRTHTHKHTHTKTHTHASHAHARTLTLPDPSRPTPGLPNDSSSPTHKSTIDGSFRLYQADTQMSSRMDRRGHRLWQSINNFPYQLVRL